MKQYLEIGKIVSTHGIAGELKVYPWADSAATLCGVQQFYLNDRGEEPIKALSARPHKNMLLLKLEGIDSLEEARRFIERTLWADRSEIPLAEGAHFVADLIGLEAVDAENGAHLGTLCDVTSGGRQDLYHVKLDSGEIRLVPAVKAFIAGVDLEAGNVSIHVIKGLLSDAD